MCSLPDRHPWHTRARREITRTRGLSCRWPLKAATQRRLLPFGPPCEASYWTGWSDGNNGGWMRLQVDGSYKHAQLGTDGQTKSSAATMRRERK
jgi:hypothetical protein